jgi:hypothetical protein
MFGLHVKVDAGVGRELFLTEADVSFWCRVADLFRTLTLGAPIHSI